MGKRGNNEGSIYKREDGRWTAALTLSGNKRRYLYGKTRQDVSKKLNAAILDRDSGLPVPPERQTVTQYLHSWLEVTRPSIRPTTFKRYEEYVRIHAVPFIGKVGLSRLTPQHLDALYAQKLSAGLSPTTVRHLHTVLKRALSQAVKKGILARNVADAVVAPRKARHEINPLNPEQAQTLLEAAKGDRLEALYVLALTTGMRQGELLALRWSDLDLDRRALQVKGTMLPDGSTAEPKTSKGRRKITLTSLAVDALKNHSLRQTKEKLTVGSNWQEESLVFPNTVGLPLDANNLRKRSLPRLLIMAGLPKIRFHDLRHSAATLLLSAGVHPKVVQEMLGHSQVSITLDTYSSVLPNLQW